MPPSELNSEIAKKIRRQTETRLDLEAVYEYKWRNQGKKESGNDRNMSINRDEIDEEYECCQRSYEEIPK